MHSLFLLLAGRVLGLNPGLTACKARAPPRTCPWSSNPFLKKAAAAPPTPPSIFIPHTELSAVNTWCQHSAETPAQLRRAPERKAQAPWTQEEGAGRGQVPWSAEGRAGVSARQGSGGGHLAHGLRRPQRTPGDQQGAGRVRQAPLLPKARGRVWACWRGLPGQA